VWFTSASIIRGWKVSGGCKHIALLPSHHFGKHVSCLPMYSEALLSFEVVLLLPGSISNALAGDDTLTCLSVTLNQ
jgi:hypothetical protein